MLGRTLSRTTNLSRSHANPRNACIRSYATKHPAQHPPPKSSRHQVSSYPGLIPGKPNGPVQNRTWSPLLNSSPKPPLNETPLRTTAPQYSQAQTVSRTQTARFSTAFSRLADSRGSHGSPDRARRRSEDEDPAKTDFSTQQPEFESATSSSRGKDPDIEPASSPAPPSSEELEPKSGDDTPVSTGPLPDLRQGIPSTFDNEVAEQRAGTEGDTSSALDLTENVHTASSGRGDGELPPEAYMTSIEKRWNRITRWIYTTMAALGLAGVVFLGQNWESEEEAKRYPGIPNGWEPSAFYGRLSARLSYVFGHYTEPAFPKLLPSIDQNMGLPPYTLVLSLEDLLISSKWSRQSGWEVAKRPGFDYFLRYLSQYYELVLFTSVQSMNADQVVKKMDPYQLIVFPLFREATRYMNGEHVKDLSYLNRDLSKTIIIDTVPGHTQLQPENAITLPKWNGKPRDPHAGDLVAMIPFLEYISAMEIDDVRKVIKSYEGTHIPTEFKRRENLAREKFNKELEASRGKRRSGSFSKGLGGAFGVSGAQKQMPQTSMMPVQPLNPSEGFAQGKMLIDQVRENAQKNYEWFDNELRVNGKKMLEEREKQEKEMMDEQMRSMQSSVLGAPKRWFGFAGDDSENKQDSDKQR